VKTQIWIAVSIYVLVAIVRKQLGLEASLYQMSGKFISSVEDDKAGVDKVGSSKKSMG
jgi:hypothetical protein